jgi:positive regulator of sigma E activity
MMILYIFYLVSLFLEILSNGQIFDHSSSMLYVIFIYTHTDYILMTGYIGVFRVSFSLGMVLGMDNIIKQLNR